MVLLPYDFFIDYFLSLKHCSTSKKPTAPKSCTQNCSFFCVFFCSRAPFGPGGGLFCCYCFFGLVNQTTIIVESKLNYYYIPALHLRGPWHLYTSKNALINPAMGLVVKGGMQSNCEDCLALMSFTSSGSGPEKIELLLQKGMKGEQYQNSNIDAPELRIVGKILHHG